MIAGCWLVSNVFVLLTRLGKDPSGEVRTARRILHITDRSRKRGLGIELSSQRILKLFQVDPWCHPFLDRIPLKLLFINQVLHSRYEWSPVCKPTYSSKLGYSDRLGWARYDTTPILAEEQ